MARAGTNSTWPPPCLLLRDPSTQPGVSYRMGQLCVRGWSAPGSPAADSGSGGRRLCSGRSVGLRRFVTSQRARSGLPPFNPLLPPPPVARRPRGRRGHRLGRREWGVGWGEARRSPEPKGRGRRGVPRAWGRGLSPRAGDVGAAHRRRSRGRGGGPGLRA